MLFAYLHRHGYLHWTDNQLTVEWDRVAAGVASLRHEVEELYRVGIDRDQAPALGGGARSGRGQRGTGVGLALGCLGP